MNPHDHSNRSNPPSGSFWTSRMAVALSVFLGIGGLLLAYEHRVHLFTGEATLLALLALCIGMHLFMHGGHGGHGGGDRR